MINFTQKNLENSIKPTLDDEDARSIHHMSKFIFILSKADSKDHDSILNFTKELHMINSVLIYEKDNNISVKIPNLFAKNVNMTLNFDQNLAEIFFPDKFKNLRNFKLIIPVANLSPIQIFENKKVSCDFCEFIEVVRQKFTFKIELREMASGMTYQQKLDAIPDELDILQNSSEIFLGTSRFISSNYPLQLQTYQPDEKCFVIANPPKIPIYEQILILPLDKTVWYMLGLSTGCCALVWFLYRNFGAGDSHWYFVFVIYGYFMGQSMSLKM